MMSVLGGPLVGIVLGLGLSLLGATLLKMPFVPSVPMTFVAFLFSGCICVGFGYFPGPQGGPSAIPSKRCGMNRRCLPDCAVVELSAETGVARLGEFARRGLLDDK